MVQKNETSTLPVEVEVQQRASTLTITSFTAIGKDDVEETVVRSQLEQLNKIAKDGFYTYAYNGLQYLIKYVQRLVLYDATRKNSAIKVRLTMALSICGPPHFQSYKEAMNNE